MYLKDFETELYALTHLYFLLYAQGHLKLQN